MQRLIIAICFLFSSIFSGTAQLTLEIQDVVSCNNTISVPIVVQQSVSLTALQFTLQWNISGLTFNSITSPLNPTPAYGPNMGMPLGNVLTMAWSSNGLAGQAFAAGATIFTLNFTVTGTVGSTYPVEFYSGSNPNYPMPAAWGPNFVQILPLNTVNGSVTVSSNIPTLICPGNITQAATAGQCGANVTWTLPTVTDCDNNANAPIEANGYAPGNFFPVGSTTITYNVSDANGNTDNCSFVILVEDEQDPTLTCPSSPVMISVPPGTTSIVVNNPQLIPVFDDNCPGETLSFSMVNGANTASGTGNANGQTFFAGTTQVTYTVTDAAMNDAVCTFNVVLVPTTTPPFILDIGDVNVECCSGTVTVPITISAATSITSIQFTISWDDTGLTYNDINSVFDPLFLGPNAGMPTNNVLTLAWAGSTPSGIPVSAGQTLFNLIFDVNSCVLGEEFVVEFYDGPNTNYPETNMSGPDFINLPVIESNGSVTIVDTSDPVLTCPANTSISCGQSTAPSNTGTATATDACDATATVTLSDVNNLTGCNNTGTIIRTWTATDDSNNSTSCVQVITVADNVPPTFTAPPAITVSCGTPLTPANTGDVTNEMDNCATGLNATFTDNTSGLIGCNGTGTIIRTWSLMDGCNTTTLTQTITVVDNMPPTFTAPPAITVSCGTPLTPANTGDVTNEMDNCATGLNATFTDNPSMPSGCNSQITRTWSLTDGCTPAVTQTQIITVVDNIAPTFTAPPAITVSCGTPLTPANTGDVTNENDNCATGLNATFTDNPSMPSGCNSQITRTWSLTDGCTPAVTQTQIITVVDNIAPTFTAPPAITVSCGTPLTPANTGDVTNENDNCATGLNATFTDNPSMPSGCNSQITRTWSLTDGCTPAVTQTQIITVVDNTPPTFTAPPAITISCSTPSTTANTGDVTNEMDNCATGLQATFTDNTSGLTGCNGTGQRIRTWSLSDGCNPTVTHTQIITVVDNTPPTFSTPLNITIDCTEDYTDLSITGDVTNEADNCSTGLQATFMDVLSGTSGCGGPAMVTRTWKLTDACGNMSTGFQIITLTNSPPPTFTAPPAVTINCEDDPDDLSLTGDVTNEMSSCNANPQATYTDNTSGLTGCNGTGQIIRTWTLNDGCSGIVSHNQIITVVDIEDPTFTAPGSVTLDCGADVDNLSLTGDVVNEMDNCSINLNATYLDNNSGLTGCNGTGQIIRTWTLADDCNNTITHTQIITVVDNTAPTFTAPAAVSISCSVSPTNLALTGDVTNEADNCDTNLQATFTDNNNGLTGCSGTGQIIRTWSLTDDCNNTTTHTQIITVVDNTAPTFTAPAAVSISCSASPTNLTLTGDVTNEADNCDTNLQATFTDNNNGLTGCSGSGQIIRTWSLTDDCNNTTTHTQIITVVDNTAPTFTAPAAVSISCSTSPANLVLTGDVTNEADNCDTNLQATFTDNNSGLTGCNGTGQIIRTWSLTDDCNNTTTHTQIITVVDNTPPTFTVPLAITLNCAVDYTNLSITGDVTNEADNCSMNVMATFTDTPSGTSPCGGPAQVIRTWTATDACGNSFTATQVITLIDGNPPPFTVPAAVTIDCEDDETNLTLTGDVTDEMSNCNPNVMATYSDNLSGLTGCNGTGQIIRTWTLNDGCSVVVNKIQIITVVDVTQPTFTVPAAVTLNCNANVNNLALTGDVNNEADNCSTNLNATYTDNASGLTGCNGTGQLIRTWSLTDACGNTLTQTQIITIVDNTAPTFTAPANITLVCTANYNSLAVTGDVTNEADNCSTGLQATFSDVATGTTSCGTPSQIIRTWTLTDNCGNSTTMTQVITLNNITTTSSFTEPPTVTISCEADPDNLALTGDVTNEFSSCNPGAQATYTDNNNGLTGCNGTGQIIRTWALNDGCSPPVVHTQTINVVDNTPPTFTVPAAVTISCETNPANLTLTGDVTNESDNCSTNLQATYTDNTNGLVGCNGTGQMLRTWSLTDACGLTTTALQIITVVDNTPPTFTDPTDVTINCINYPLSLAVVGDVTNEADNCSTNLQATFSDAESGNTVCNSPSQVIRTWTLTDACGNSTTATQVITLLDCDPPAFTVPPGLTISCSANPSDLALTGDVTNETSTCNPNPQATYSDDLSGLTGCNGSGQIIRTWTLDDECCGMVSATQIITVADNTAPQALCQNVTIELGINGTATVSVAQVNNGSTDNCQAAATLSFSLSQTLFNCSHLGANTIVMTVTDACGNSSTCTTVVTVKDLISPDVSCPSGNIVVNADLGECTASGVWMLATGTDNCGNVTITSSHNNNSTFPVGTTVVTNTATDEAGNVATCTYTITVVDAELPVINCDPGQFAYTPVGNCGVLVSWNPITATDNCPNGLTLTSTHNSGTVFPIGQSTTITYTAEDNAGNTSTCSFVIAAQDETAPVITNCPSNVTISAQGAACQAVYNWSIMATDNCSTPVVTCIPASGSTFPLGETVVTCTATDLAGNSSTCSFTVTVEDNTPPLTDCAADVEIQIDGTILNDPDGIILNTIVMDNCDGVLIDYVLPQATDLCGPDIMVTNLSGPSGSVFMAGTNLVEFSFTDEYGNTSTCSWLIIVVPIAQSAVQIVPVSGTELCEGENLLLLGEGLPGIYTWTDPNNNVITNESLSTENISTAGSGIYELSVTTGAGCVVTNEIEIVVNPIPSVTTTSNSPVCEGNLLLSALQNPGSPLITNWSWTGPCGFSSDMPVVDMALQEGCDGTYTLLATSDEGCIYSVALEVVSPPMLSPDLTLGCDEVICINEGCILLGTAFSPTPDAYNWSASPNGGLPANTNQNSIAINPETTGTFTYEYWISIDGCESDTASLTVEVVDRPEVNNDFFETNYQLPIENFTVTDNDVITPQLTDGDIQVIALPMDGTLQMNSGGEFTYIPNDGFIGIDFFLYQICYNCEESQCDTGRVELRVYFEGDCEVPNIITSNGDGINDELVINCLETGDFPDSEMTVYNNWGDKVFHASPYENDWDGTLKGKEGKPLPDGTYYFIFKESPSAKAQKGYVMIFR